MQASYRQPGKVRFVTLPASDLFTTLGFVIYFSYGIHHSAEASLARSSPDTEMASLKPDRGSEPNTPEKEAFFQYPLVSQEEDDGDL